uniref:Uncharacterized protein n=1 Tax=Octopus bimaculoides TaxID=37653 RepID=A0A0L8GYJ4_OCTBM
MKCVTVPKVMNLMKCYVVFTEAANFSTDRAQQQRNDWCELMVSSLIHSTSWKLKNE